MPDAKKQPKKKAPKSIAGTRSLSAFVKSICDILRRSNCASALQYVPELTWILFLRILDAQEKRDREAAEAVGESFTPALASPFRWQDWAAPFKDDPAHPKTDEGKPYGWKRQELFSKGDGKLFDFINTELLPHLHGLDIDPKTKLPNPNASRKQRVIGRIMTAVERVRVDSETNLRDILDKVDEISIDHVDDTHFFTLSQVYEDLLLKMGEKNSDGGQFFTPREVIRAMVHTLDPKLGETIYDPCCGTGGFLAVAYEHIARNLGNAPASTDIDTLKHDTFFGREKENLVFPIALANLVLHGIDQPNLWHGNTLTKRASYGALFDKAPKTFDVILTNPPFGGKEGKDAQKNYAYATSSTQVLFVQHILGELAPGGRCAIVLDDGFLFRKDEDAFVETKRKLVDECDLWAIVSLPGGVFVGAGAAVKTNLLFFTKGKKTEQDLVLRPHAREGRQEVADDAGAFRLRQERRSPRRRRPARRPHRALDRGRKQQGRLPQLRPPPAQARHQGGRKPLLVDRGLRRPPQAGPRGHEAAHAMRPRAESRGRVAQGEAEGPEGRQSQGQEDRSTRNEDRRTGESRPRSPSQSRRHRRRCVRSESREPERRGED